MRFSQFLICILVVVAFVSNSFTMAAVITSTPTLTVEQEAKISSSLLKAVRADPQVEANIMVQLESPEEAMHRVCGDGASLTRAQKTTCMVDNMQKFADESQQQVKELLQQHEGEYSDSTFFWINNSVSVKKAKGTLVLALATLDTVLQVRSEQIFHTMGSGGGKGEQKPAKSSFGFGVLN